MRLLTSLSKLLCEIVGASGWMWGVRDDGCQVKNLRISASAPSVTKEMVPGDASGVLTTFTIGLLYNASICNVIKKNRL